MIESFILFGIAELFILLLFYRLIGKVKEVKYWHIFILSPIFILSSIVTIPFGKQLLMILIMLIYLWVIDKGFNIKLVVLGFLYLLVIEMIICSILDLLFSFDFTQISIINKFLTMIPIRFIEIILILFYKKERFIWDLYGCQRLKKKLK